MEGTAPRNHRSMACLATWVEHTKRVEPVFARGLPSFPYLNQEAYVAGHRDSSKDASPSTEIGRCSGEIKSIEEGRAETSDDESRAGPAILDGS